MAIIITAIFIASLAYAIYVGSYNQDQSYLLTTTRAWQLAFGGLLALAGSTIRLPKRLRLLGGWIGLAMIVSCGLVLDGRELFPGPWAFWPLIGLTLILISAGPNGGSADPVGSATHFLSNRALSWIGDHAYGLYLWHWPLVIFYLELRGQDSFGIGGTAIILAITVVLAVLTYRFIETPIKNRQRTRPKEKAGRANIIVVATAAGALTLGGAWATWTIQEDAAPPPRVSVDWDWETYPGAMVTTPEYSDTPVIDNYVPAVEDLRFERADVCGVACVTTVGNGPGLDEVNVCEDPDAPEDPTATIVISGGSHSVHWLAAYRALAAEHDWEALVVNKDACGFALSEAPDRADCQSWTDNYIEWLEENEVDLVVANGTRIFDTGTERIEEGAQDRGRRLSTGGLSLSS